MKIAIVHHTLSSIGGGEKVFTYTVKALNDAGIIPDVYSTNPVSPDVLERFYGVKTSFVLKKKFYLKLKLPLFGIYQRLLSAYASSSLSNYDVIVNTTGVYTPVKFSGNPKYILYIYNPMTSVFGSIDPNDMTGKEKYQKNLFWKLYYKPFEFLVRRSIRSIGENKNVFLLSVSEFTRRRVKKYWGYESFVVYPPVDINRFSMVNGNYAGRHGVISISRFSPEKNHLLQLEIAEQLKNVTFRFVGSANTTHMWYWYEYVRSIAEEKDLKNVEFYPNISFNRLLELIGESKVFIHAMRNEDFGLAPAEAISGGVLPAVIDSGGLREVVPYPEYRWYNVKDAVKKILFLHTTDPREHEERIRKLRRHIMRFSPEQFMGAMRRFILEL